MTSQQKATIEKLTRALGIGSRVDQGIKHVLGKMPINMSESRAASIIDSLTEEWNASDAKAELDWEREHAANNYADCGRVY